MSDEELIVQLSEYVRRHGYGPSLRDMAEACGLSHGAVSLRMRRLREEGAVSYDDGVPRSLRVREGGAR